MLWWLACILTSPMAMMLALIFGFVGVIIDFVTLICWAVSGGFLGRKCCTPDNCRTYCECREEEPGALTRCDEYWCCIAV